ncbi:MAG: glycoside hydrolase family 3 protein [Anaerolineae bacterium]
MKRFRLNILLGVVLLCVLPTRAQVDPVEARLAQMTLEHKVGQMFMVNLFGLGLTEAGRAVLQEWQPGAVVLTDSNIDTPEQITRLTNAYQQTITEAGGPPLIVAVDQEGGIIARLQEGFTTWPVPMLLTAANDPVLARDVGAAMGAELRAVGVNMNLAPVVDLQTNLRNPIIGRRSPGSDGALVGQMVTGFIEGMRSAGVLAATKHFPGHGDTSEDSHTTLPELPHDLERLSAVELPPFINAIQADTGAVMMAHIWFSAFDETIQPASLSYNIITGLLRERLGYNGIIMTDAMDMDAIDTAYSAEEAAVQAVLAGNDFLLVGANAGEGIQRRMMQAVVDAVLAGTIDESRIEESVRRILTAKAELGLLEWTPLDPVTARERIDLNAHAALIEVVFDAGVSLVRDEASVIPFNSEANVGIVYPGNRALVQRECDLYTDSARWLAVSDRPGEDEIRTVAALAAQVDTVVVFTRDAVDNTAQQVLVNALPPEKTFVVALISPFDALRFPTVAGYMVTYSPLDPGIATACAILFGAQPARGVLSVALSE